MKRMIDNRAFSPGIKWPGREANHSPSYGAEVKNAWSYNSIPPYGSMTWCLIKQRIRFHDMVLRYAQGQVHSSVLCQQQMLASNEKH
jgi:hypothetical protein